MSIKLGTTNVLLSGYAKAYLNDNLIWLADLPSSYTRVDGFEFGGDCYFEIDDFKLSGNDTVRFKFKPKSGCNVFGSYISASANNNYSLYISTSSTAKYMRYNGGTYASGFTSSELNKEYNVVISPTGSSGLPRNGSWTRTDFTCGTNMYIGTTSTIATSAKYKGEIIGNFIVDGRFCGVPCKRTSDNTLGYFDLYSRTFYVPDVGSPTEI